jgi:hypothetical protein
VGRTCQPMLGTRGILVLAVRERATVVGRWASDSIGVLHGIEPLDMRFQKQVARAAEGRGGSVAAPGACAVIVTEILAVRSAGGDWDRAAREASCGRTEKRRPMVVNRGRPLRTHGLPGETGAHWQYTRIPARAHG